MVLTSDCSSLNMAEKCMATLLFRLVVLIIYILLGSLLFSHIEIKRSSREELNDKVSRGISVLLRQNSCSVNLSETQLKAFVWQVFEQVNGESDGRWQFKDGLTFSFELLTTIGYGTSPPTTQTGRLLSMFYALFGIPLFLVVLKDGGEIINKQITKAVLTVEKNLFRTEQPQNVKGKVLCVFAFAMVLCILALAAKVYTYPKYGNPTYIDALYVLFITFTTVGFGDITFEGTSRSIPMALLGLTLMSTIINAISVWFETRGSVRCMKCYKVNSTRSVCSESMNHTADNSVEKPVPAATEEVGTAAEYKMSTLTSMSCSSLQ